MQELVRQEVVMICGIMASGKSTLAKQYIDKDYVYLNRDKMGGRVADLVPHLVSALTDNKSVVIDNTHPTITSRKQFIDVAVQYKVPIYCKFLDATVDDAQMNASLRMIERYGKVLGPAELQKHKDPNVFPPMVLFSYAKNLEKPTVGEGFESVEIIPFVRQHKPEYTGKALLLDFDGTLRRTISGAPYPTTPNDIEILPNRIETLQRYRDNGYVLLGVSNQSGVAKGSVSNGAVQACFERTNELLRLDIDYVYCPHPSNPLVCYCRKPSTATAAWFITKYKLNPSRCLMIGDFTSDETFARRSGFRYIDQAEFFK